MSGRGSAHNGEAPGDPAPTRDRSGWTQARRFILIAFMAWLSTHFVTGGWV